VVAETAVEAAGLQAAPLEASAGPAGTQIIPAKFFTQFDIARAPNGCRFSRVFPKGMTADVSR